MENIQNNELVIQRLIKEFLRIEDKEKQKIMENNIIFSFLQ